MAKQESTKQPTCEDRIDGELIDATETLGTLWKLYNRNPEAYHDDYGRFDEYGSDFSYVEPGTFKGQREGYWTYLISGGGPSDEFRFFVNPDKSIHRIEYWFLDWYDGAHRILDGEQYELLEAVGYWYLGVPE